MTRKRDGGREGGREGGLTRIDLRCGNSGRLFHPMDVVCGLQRSGRCKFVPSGEEGGREGGREEGSVRSVMRAAHKGTTSTFD